MIRLLIVEDSPTQAQCLLHIFEKTDDICVVAIAQDGEKAFCIAKRRRPDVILMDIELPGIDGYETTRKIMENCPVPIVLMSSVCDVEQIKNSFRSLGVGAVAATAKPSMLVEPMRYDDIVQQFVQTVRLMSEVKVVRRWSKKLRKQNAQCSEHAGLAEQTTQSPVGEIDIIAIGASTGGPRVLSDILSFLPVDFPFPILIVQHITSGFVEGLAEWLKGSTKLPIIIARNQEPIHAGRVYIAPCNWHMEVARRGVIVLKENMSQSFLCPSISRLFYSVAQYYTSRALAILLTGMGNDGAAELKLLRDKGARTIVQNQESCVVYGMPGEAMKIGAACAEMTPRQIASTLVNLTPSIFGSMNSFVR